MATATLMIVVEEVAMAVATTMALAAMTIVAMVAADGTTTVLVV
jgi:hypothetical protein